MNKVFLIFAVFMMQFSFSQKTKIPKPKVKENKTTEQKFELTKDQTTLYNGLFFKFIDALKSSDKKTMEDLLSDKAKIAITEKVYQKLSEDIHFDKKIVIFKTGYKSLMSGGNVPMIQYKYADDKSDFPKEIITAVFEENGKILGIKPYKRE